MNDNLSQLLYVPGQQWDSPHQEPTTMQNPTYPTKMIFRVSAVAICKQGDNYLSPPKAMPASPNTLPPV